MLSLWLFTALGPVPWSHLLVRRVAIAQIGLLLSSTSLSHMSYSCLHSLYAAHAESSHELVLCGLCCISILAGGCRLPLIYFHSNTKNMPHCVSHTLCRQHAVITCADASLLYILLRQDFSCTYLAHHELESVLFVILMLCCLTCREHVAMET